MYHRVVPNILDPSIECYTLMNIVVSQQRFEKQINSGAVERGLSDEEYLEYLEAHREKFGI